VCVCGGGADVGVGGCKQTTDRLGGARVFPVHSMEGGVNVAHLALTSQRGCIAAGGACVFPVHSMEGGVNVAHLALTSQRGCIAAHLHETEENYFV
jgi:hypothetical protein